MNDKKYRQDKGKPFMRGSVHWVSPAGQRQTIFDRLKFIVYSLGTKANYFLEVKVRCVSPAGQSNQTPAIVDFVIFLAVKYVQ